MGMDYKVFSFLSQSLTFEYPAECHPPFSVALGLPLYSLGGFPQWPNEKGKKNYSSTVWHRQPILNSVDDIDFEGLRRTIPKTVATATKL